jgi:hypothetical protein
LGHLALFGQSRDETADFIIKEMRSLEDKTFFMTDISFSPSGELFTLRRRHQGKPDKSVVLSLKQVDIYCCPTHHAGGSDFYKLVARSRGRDGQFTVNGLTFHGSVNLVGRSLDKRKMKALERAFGHMAALAGGRKELFDSK